MAFAMNALLTLAVLLSGVQAAPNLNYPLMDQQPPVARIDQTFVFTLLPGTFNTTAGTISYTTGDLPSWLQFNTGSAAFYGTPTASDEGQQSITITARDNDGTTDSSFDLIVTPYTVPGVHQGFSTQISNDDVVELASVQRLSGGGGITVPPYWSFSLGFLYETFRLSRTDPVNGDLFFSARERGTTTLPSWLTFNNNTMTFNGVAPAEGTFTIVATGSDFWGYTGAQTSFIIEVGTGEGIEVDRMSNFSDIVAKVRMDVDYQVDISDILIGGQAATADQVTLSLDSPEFSWLSIDGSGRITGKTPDAYINGTVTPLAVPLTIASTNVSNTLELVAYIGLDILPYPFTTLEFPNVTAKPGSVFEFDLSPYVQENITPLNMTVLAATAPINTTVFPTEAAQWLTFHEGNLTLEGIAPQSPGYDHVEVEFTAGQSGNIATSTLTIAMEGITNSPPTGGTTSLPSTTGTESSGGGGGLSMGARIAIGVVFGVLGLILLLLLLWFCCRRRRKNKEADEKAMDDGDSFVVGSPGQDPFRKSHNADPPRNLLGEFAKFSGFHIRSPSADGPRSPEMQEKPHRLDGLRGIFGWGEQANIKKVEEVPPPNSSHGSFFGQGDVISIRDPMDRPSQSASSFDQTFGSSSGSSRASWESRESFQWSSVENDQSNEGPGNRLSTTASVPRPRENFVPRYPRNNSPSRLANLASQHTLNSPEFSEFHGSSNDDSLSHTLASSSGSSGPSSGYTGANRFDSTGGFRSIDEEDEGGDTDVEGPAIVTMAERQSLETRNTRPAEHSTHRLSHSNFAALGPAMGQGGYRQSVADSAFDDADTTEIHGLGYPASSIFGSPGSDATRGVSMISSNPRNSYDPRASTIRAIPEHETAMSPPLPQVGSFAREITRPQPHMMHRPKSMTSDGRVIACANETFSMHPTISPPPRIALSAATWSSNPPSSYRAEVDGGGSLPTWLHFDARELELWGVPALANAGDVTTLKIVEILPRDKRRSDPSQFGYEPPQERVVGRVIVEVVDRLKSPQFALENSPHAF